MTQIDQIEVTQGDREAAARIYQLFRDYDYAKWIMEGQNASGDYDKVIQAFARYRIASEEAAVLRGVKAGLEAAAIEGHLECIRYQYGWVGCGVEQAILALDPQAIAKETPDAQ